MLPGGANPPMSFFLYEGAPVIETYYTDAETTILVGDCLEYLTDSNSDDGRYAGPAGGRFDLVLTSPPYEDCRTYGIGFDIKGEAWVKWAMERYLACYEMCHGLTCWVVEGKTKDFRWSATPALLMADLHRAGVGLRKPPVFRRVGIPGSGGPDWLRNDYEFMICATHGKLPWSENTAMGHPPKWGPGGEMSNRLSNGGRVNGRDKWGRDGSTGNKDRNGNRKPQTNKGVRLGTGPNLKGGCEVIPAIANPGNVIQQTYTAEQVAELLAEVGDVSEHNVGGGVMGSKTAHFTEAPYPESLCEFIIKTFAPPGGTVLDPFCGSGTTLAVARRLGRKAVGIDIRRNQAELSLQRVAEVVADLTEGASHA